MIVKEPTKPEPTPLFSELEGSRDRLTVDIITKPLTSEGVRLMQQTYQPAANMEPIGAFVPALWGFA